MHTSHHVTGWIFTCWLHTWPKVNVCTVSHGMHVPIHSSKREGLKSLKTKEWSVDPKQFMQTSSSSPAKHSSEKGTKTHEREVGYHDVEAGGFLLQSQTQNKQPLSNKKNSTSISYDFKKSSKNKAKYGHLVHSFLQERRKGGMKNWILIEICRFNQHPSESICL